MRLPILIATLALTAAPACAPYPPLAGPTVPREPVPVGPTSPGGGEAAHVEVEVRIMVVDRAAVARAGLDYVVLGGDRVRVSVSPRGGARDARIAAGTHGVTAFLDAARASRWVASESTQRVLTLSGGEGFVSSTELAEGRYASRTRGPSLAVRPTILEDGRVHLEVSARHEDSVTYAWGYGVDGSPAVVDTELIATPGREVLLASSTSAVSTRATGLLHWAATEQDRDVLVTVTAEVVYP